MIVPSLTIVFLSSLLAAATPHKRYTHVSRGEGRRIRFTTSAPRNVDIQDEIQRELQLIEHIYSDLSQQHQELSRNRRSRTRK